jgi:hypothetical protein
MHTTAASFTNERDFVESLETAAVPCRIYSRVRSDTPVIVPKNYARQLDAVRELRRQIETALCRRRSRSAT